MLMPQTIGHISQVIGPVVDVYFDGAEAELKLPGIHDALEVRRPNGKKLNSEPLKTGTPFLSAAAL